MPALFALTTFLSAALLFWLEPMFAKMVLPLLGGTPAVWNTCLVFFQVCLLAGYAYAHAAPARLGVRLHAALHLFLLLAPFWLLPVVVGGQWQPRGDVHPTLWLLGLLAAVVGLPFFAVSTNSTLLQKWFANLGHDRSADPYFLYAFGNAGSMLALLAYPLLLEPRFPLKEQSRFWAAGYAVLVVLMAVCGLAVCLAGRRVRSQESEVRSQKSEVRKYRKKRGRRAKNSVLSTQYAVRRTETSSPAHDQPSPTKLTPVPCPLTPELTPARRARWLVLAFVPSSLVVSVTTYLTTDIAAVPLLWVVPLAVYLLTFILVFARTPPLPHYWMVRAQPLVVIVLAIVILSEATEMANLPVFALLGLHLFALFVLSMVCHGELAKDRPPAEHLTEFYLWLAAGGALGGLFAALAAPLLFPTVAEYPLALVLACLLMPRLDTAGDDARKRRNDFLYPAVLGAVTAAVVFAVQGTDVGAGQASVALMFAVPAVVCYTFLQRPVRFGLAVAALFLAGGLYHGVHGQVLYRERSFFGVHRVTRDPTGRFHELVHGSTVHGRQHLLFRKEPLTYYHPTGPIGQVFRTFSGKDAKPHVGLVGLGAGSLAAYGEKGQRFTYYEIDPAVARIARDPRFFTFLGDSQADVNIVLGDARLTLAGAPPHGYGLIVMDAFSSDAIPLHLLTREALQLYLSKLADGGVIVFNISNRYFDLEPVLADLARAEGLVCWSRADLDLSPVERESGKSPSQWVVMARKTEHLGQLTRLPGWAEVRPPQGQPVWTDDFSNLFGVFKWGE